MRFSLKWILAAVVYVAIAAAAFSQQTWVYADILWAMSLLAVVFASLLAILARGRKRIAAGGFLLSSACYLLCLVVGLLLGGDVVPTTRLLTAAGFEQNTWSAYPYVMPPPQVAVQPTISSGTPIPAMAPVYPTPVTTTAVATPIPKFVDFAIYVRAGNAIGMMLFGLLGCIVGALAYKVVRRDAASP